MTDFERGVQFGRERYSSPLVETLRIAQERGTDFMDGTVAGLLEQAG